MPVVKCPNCKIEHFVKPENETSLCKKCRKKVSIIKAKKKQVRKPPRKSTMIPCQQCGTKFYARVSRIEAGNDKYCSRKCAGEARRIERTTDCPWCGNLFVKRTGQIFCSRSCAALSNHASSEKNRKGGRCIVCHNHFVHGVSSKICSHACLVAHRKSLGVHNVSYSLESDPWETGAIQPDRFAWDMFRQPDPVLGF